MDFDQAIKAHTDWKAKLSAYLRKPDGSLKAADIQVDNRCDLGKWIHGDGSKFASVDGFGELKSEHAKFHVAAAEVVKKADAGKSTSEDTALGSQSPFSVASNNVIKLIMAIRRKVS